MSFAKISKCGQYRYILGRYLNSWSQSKPERVVTFIMLNPSTADAEQDDATIRRCIGFGNRLKCDKLLVVNLWAYRATDPSTLFELSHHQAEGPENEHWVTHAVAEADIVVCAWGTHGRYADQDLTVVGWVDGIPTKLSCLGLTREGHPKHPLYLAAPTRLRTYTPRSISR